MTDSTERGAASLELAPAYVPMDRRQAMARGRAISERSEGTAMFADISGFTPLTEALDQQLGSRRSGEELTRHLNRVYGALIEQVHRYRGSVIGFSGDAITCWFEGDRGPRAATCGLGLHAAMRGLKGVPTPSGPTHTLSIKVAVTAGRALRRLVGSRSVQVIDVLAGSMIDRLARAEQAAQRGHLVVDRAVVEALPTEAIVTRTLTEELVQIVAMPSLAEPDPWPPLAPGSLSAEQLRPWLLPAVWDRLQSQQGDFLAELRPAVPLFVRFSGLDFETDPDVGETLDAYVCWTQQVLERYGGSLVQLSTGEKGSYLYAVFGAPVAHEDDVPRALAAAAQLREPPRHLASITAVQLGMSRGRVRAGGYGSETRRTYGALGDETNVAARLMSKAEPGQILVSQRIGTAAGEGHALCSLGEVQLKGKSTALPVFAYEGRRQAVPSRSGAATPIVGRAQERAIIHAAVDRLHNEGDKGALIIEGEAGIGKSCLLRDSIQYVADEAPSLLMFRAASDSLESATAYFAWRPVFAQLFGVQPDDDSARVQARVEERLPASMMSLAPLLSAVIDVEEGDSDDPRLRGNMRAASLPRYLSAVFVALTAPARVVVVVEDGHWLDSSSWTLLGLVHKAHPALLVVLSTRPLTDPPVVYRTLLQRPGTQHVPLGAMLPEDVLTLVSRRLGVSRLSDEVAALIAAKAEGNPFFGEELAHALVEAGLVDEEGEHLGRLESFDFPDTIEALVTGRIDRLAASEQFALKVASVIGRGFTLRTLRDLFPAESERERLPAMLGNITAMDLIRPDAPAPAPSYIFKHAITQDVAYNLMLFEQRRALHRAAAEWYEQAYVDDLAPFYSLLAHHRVKAIEGAADAPPDLIRRAVVALARASQHALQSGATPEALAQASAGLELLERSSAAEGRERDELELQLRSVRGPALVLARGPTDDEVQREFDRTAQLCQEQGETARLFEAVFGIWYFHFIRANRQGAIDFSRRLYEIAEATQVSAIWSRALEARGSTLISEGRYIEGRACMTEAIERVGTTAAVGVAQSRDPAVTAHSYRAWAQCFLGYPDQALADVDRAIAQAQTVAHPLAMAQAVSFGAHVYRYRREPEQVEQMGQRGLQMCLEHGFLMWEAGGKAVLGWVALERGDYPRAAQLLVPAQQMAKELEFGIISMVARTDLIDTWTRMGRYDDAAALIDEAKTVQRDALSGFCEPEVLRLEGELWRLRGDDVRAEASLQAGLDMARATEMKWLELRIARSLGRLWGDHGRSADARAMVCAVVEWFTEGLETPDLLEARALVDSLSSPA